MGKRVRKLTRRNKNMKKSLRRKTKLSRKTKISKKRNHKKSYKKSHKLIGGDLIIDTKTYMLDISDNAREIYKKLVNTAALTLKNDDGIESMKCMLFIQAMIDARSLNKEYIIFYLDSFIDVRELRQFNPDIDDTVNNFATFCERMIMIGLRPEIRLGDHKYTPFKDPSTGDFRGPYGKITYEPWWAARKEDVNKSDRKNIKDTIINLYKIFRGDEFKKMGFYSGLKSHVTNLMDYTDQGYGGYEYLLLTAIILKYYAKIDIKPQLDNLFPREESGPGQVRDAWY